MLAYEPDDALAHRLDPRSKLAFQVGFAAVALAYTAPAALAILTALALTALAAARASLRRSLHAFRYALVFLGAAPILAAATAGPPWIDVADGLATAVSSYRVVLILLVSAAYVRSTPVRASRAAIQRTVPGKPGRVLGVGVALVFRTLPVLAADVRAIREAMAARVGDERSAIDRAARIGALGLSRAFERADRLAIAMQARCFSWNPTLPPLAFSRLDAPVLAVAALLLVAAFA